MNRWIDLLNHGASDEYCLVDQQAGIIGSLPKSGRDFAGYEPDIRHCANQKVGSFEEGY